MDGERALLVCVAVLWVVGERMAKEGLELTGTTELAELVAEAEHYKEWIGEIIDATDTGRLLDLIQRIDTLANEVTDYLSGDHHRTQIVVRDPVERRVS
jgi:hypothetical protein